MSGRWTAINALEARGVVGSFTNQTALAPLLAGTGYTGRDGLCHTSNLNPAYFPDGFCWTPADDVSSVWTPQGSTGSHDAQPGGTWFGKYVYIASWHNKTNTMSRISVVDNSTGGAPIYNNVLLVDPYGSGTSANFKASAGHADGITWYGNKLFLATGHVIQVYDLRHLWKLGAHTDQVGVTGSTASAAYHNYALPMIGSYSNGSGDCTATAPCPTSLSPDRNGTDSLVTSQFMLHGGGPVVRWPLNAADALLETNGPNNYTGAVTANAAYRVPIWKVQGAATDGTYYYFSGLCPEFADSKIENSDDPYCIHRAKPGEAPHVLTRAPRLTQNLSWSPSAGRLWGINERLNYSDPSRMVFSINPPN
ncbi:hypothetical protein ACF9IK_31300 [Kitasatospora hibisci]|uniref:hypothetical protein n=1 Tax=Kitasatospora hibisci TaxID=3369522 RepID=UPI003753FD20